MKRFVVLGSVMLAACSVSASEGYRMINGIDVNAVNSEVFEVVARTGGPIADFWCGASNFARDELGASWQDYLYVVGGAGVGVTSASPSTVQFAMAPSSEISGASGRDSHWGPELGDKMKIQAADVECQFSNSME